MASETSPEPPTLDTPNQATTNENLTATKPPDPNDPAFIIRNMLTIVEGLHSKLVPQSQSDEAILTTSRSQGAAATTVTDPQGGGGSGGATALTTAMSLPVMTQKQTEEDSERYIPKLRRNLGLLREDVKKLQELRVDVADEVAKHLKPLKKLSEKVGGTTKLTKGMKKDLEDINKKIFNLMVQVPLLPNKRRKPGGLDNDGGDKINNGKGIDCLPAIHANDEHLKRLAVFKSVVEKFKGLTNQLRICLLSFAVFPENQEVNRTMLMYWWIGEGILDVKPTVKGTVLDVKDKPENAVKVILKEFMDQKLIEAVENKRKVEPNSYKMSPFVHSSVVLISKEIGLFKMYIKGEKPKMKQSDLRKVCLVEGSSSQSEAKAKKMEQVNLIETIFNVSERFPDFTFKWFSDDQTSAKKKFGALSKTAFKNLMVFYLGRWERTAKRHIEVENPELMKNLKYMIKLKLLSFQGISRIERLDDAVTKLRELVILDLRACYNLEKLPEKIDSLKALIYLDITDCYMIDRIPKRLSWLKNLEVLKGFVVSDAIDVEKVCTLTELKHLEKLRKLSISINKGDLTVEKLFSDIEGFKSLEKLKVAWGGINEHKKEVSEGGLGKLYRQLTGLTPAQSAAVPGLQRPPKLPGTLKKLDLQCFPVAELPEWLYPGNLRTLEKFYIKGGIELKGFGSIPEKPTECSVKILRLKFLPRLNVEWRDLKQLYFPKLEFLDKYQCPQVSFCPCDGIGIWRKKK